jgi:alkylated DNA nucleotide flippase Atl1
MRNKLFSVIRQGDAQGQEERVPLGGRVKKTWAEELADKPNFPKVVTIVEICKKLKIPYWRTLKADGFLNEKYPGGLEAQKTLLEKEGHKIVRRGKKYQVADFEKHLIA